MPKGQVWKRIWILKVWSENGSGKWHFLGQDFENRAAHPHQEFPGAPPPGLRQEQLNT